MDWTEIVSVIVNSLILPLLAWAVAELTSFLGEKIENEKAEKYAKFATEAVYTAVTQTMQTFVSTLKKNGEWSEESAKTALEKAKAVAIVTMGETAKAAIEEMTGDFDTWLEAQIETYILELKEMQKNG